MKDSDYLKEVLVQYLLKERPPMGMPEALESIAFWWCFWVCVTVMVVAFLVFYPEVSAAVCR